jgi:hypothetical protein
VHEPEVLATVGVDDHGRAQRRRLVGLPEKELLAVPLECDLDELGHGYSRN